MKFDSDSELGESGIWGEKVFPCQTNEFDSET